ncbi:MAG: cyanophycinase [Actinomycetota bacterium]
MRRLGVLTAIGLAVTITVPVLSTPAGALVQRGYGYRSWLRGDPADVGVPVSSGAMLEGGAKDLRAAWSWFLQRAGYGDIVLICATCDNEYNSYVFSIHDVNSMQTLKITKRRASSDPFVVDSVAGADGIFFAGGDQSDYKRIWAGTPVDDAINRDIQRGVPIGGISAGLAISGQFAFTADKNTVTSAKAMSDCYGHKIQLMEGMVEYPSLRSMITDSHFTEQGRMGRLMTFMARILTDRRTSSVKGIGIDAATAVLLDTDGIASVIGEGNATFIRMRPADVVTCAPGEPVSTRVVRVDVIGDGGTFDTASWSGDANPPLWAQISDGTLIYPAPVPTAA